jgi:hypothetical protein
MARSAPHRAALGTAALLLGVVVACTGDAGPALLLLPADGGDLDPVSASLLVELLGPEAEDLGDVRAATTVQTVPQADPDSCQGDWRGTPSDAPVVALAGVGYTRVRSGPLDAGGSLVLVCDYDADGRLLVADDLRTTGTDQAVGNDYAVRAGSVLGRVDVGIPPDAAIALQRFDTWTLFTPLAPDMAVLRLHALEGGSQDEGYDIGTIRFFDAAGVDITAASVPIPDVIHGVPRIRGSGVDADGG